jgi:hypothetical protein
LLLNRIMNCWMTNPAFSPALRSVTVQQHGVESPVLRGGVMPTGAGPGPLRAED